MFEKSAQRKERVKKFEDKSDIIKAHRDMEDAAETLSVKILERHQANLERLQVDVSTLDPVELRASYLAHVLELYQGWVDDVREEYDSLIAQCDEKKIEWTKQLDADRLR